MAPSDHFRKMTVSFIIAGAVAAAFLLNASSSGRLLELIRNHDEWEAQGPRFVRQDAPDATGNQLMTFKLDVQLPAATAAVAPQPSAAPVRSTTQAAPVRNTQIASFWIRHIGGTLALFNIKGPATQRSNASASVSDVVAGPQPAAAPQGAADIASAAPPSARSSRASYVHYGATSRADIMSAGSGPVYNFAGSKR